MSEESLHHRLSAAILNLGLVPGQRISERGLEPEFGGSRTPIRAALLRLESEGLVRRDGKNWLVSPIDLGEIREMYEYREIVESASARLASARATAAELDALYTLAGLAESAETAEHSIEAGTSFHLQLATLSGNPLLIDSIDGILTRLYRTRWLEVQSLDSRRTAQTEHRAIASALLAHDADAAELATREHLRGTGERLVASLERNHRQLRAGGISLGEID